MKSKMLLFTFPGLIARGSLVHVISNNRKQLVFPPFSNLAPF